MGQISSNGAVRAHVTSGEEIATALAEFNSLVQEAVLIEGREFNLNLNFGAYEGPAREEITELF